MKVKDRMSTEVKAVQLDTSLTEAFRLMKEGNIRRLPVQDKGKLVGIITLSDLNQAAPSSATSLSVHELNYLLAKTKIKDILPKKQEVITVTPDTYIETAAKIMRKNKVSGLTGYNTGTYYPGEKWREFAHIYDPLYRLYSSVFEHPFMITEFGSNSVGGDKVAWIEGMFAAIDQFPRIKVAVWWNGIDWDAQMNPARIYRIDENNAVLDAFARGLKNHKATE
jgi:CBS domain-containing protein